MIKNLGRGSQTGWPLALLDLTDPEREALAWVLTIAEAHLDEIPFPKLRSCRRAAEMLVCELREALELPVIKPQLAPEPFEAVLGRLSGQQ
jgi:hypothetical protein